MTPQEKAKELVNKYFKESNLLYEDLTWIQAKECALIAVDEIINIKLLWYQKDTKELDYCKQVKQEIEKL
jgi:hypothetical protein